VKWKRSKNKKHAIKIEQKTHIITSQCHPSLKSKIERSPEHSAQKLAQDLTLEILRANWSEQLLKDLQGQN